jgi:hypothetical protein
VSLVIVPAGRRSGNEGGSRVSLYFAALENDATRQSGCWFLFTSTRPEMDEQSPKPPSRRWLQFSLRTLLIVMLVVAAYFGGRIPVLRELEATKEKMAAVEKTAQEAMMQSLVAREQAEAQRLVAEQQLQIARTLMQTQSHGTQRGTDSENGASAEAASNRSKDDGN